MSRPTATNSYPTLVGTSEAAKIPGRAPATLKRWRHEGIGPEYIEIEGRISYDIVVLLDYIKLNTRVLPCGLQWRILVELFDDAEALRFPGSPANGNTALRTLSRMLRKAKEWKLIRYAPEFKLSRRRRGRSSWTMKSSASSCPMLPSHCMT